MLDKIADFYDQIEATVNDDVADRPLLIVVMGVCIGNRSLRCTSRCSTSSSSSSSATSSNRAG
jgi:hypothetical protein